MVGILGRVISPSQGLCQHRTTQHKKTRTKIHALRGFEPAIQCTSDQGPRGQWIGWYNDDQQVKTEDLGKELAPVPFRPPRISLAVTRD
jgi:hypothetical protein